MSEERKIVKILGETIAEIYQMDIVRIICAILLPPLGVFLQVGLGKDFWINVLLTIFGLYVLGLVHAIWVIARKS